MKSKSVAGGLDRPGGGIGASAEVSSVIAEVSIVVLKMPPFRVRGNALEIVSEGMCFGIGPCSETSEIGESFRVEIGCIKPLVALLASDNMDGGDIFKSSELLERGSDVRRIGIELCFELSDKDCLG